MRWKIISMMSGCVGGTALASAIFLGPLAVTSGAASPVVTTTSSLAPGLVTGGLKTLYAASWTNQGKAVLTNTVILITLPSGSAVLSATPDLCSAAQAATSDPLVLSCPRGNLASGETLTEQLLVRLPEVAVQSESAISAVLKGDEKTSDADKSHVDTFPAPDQPVTIVPRTADAAGSCLQDGDAALATQGGPQGVPSSANPLITAAASTGPIGLFCAPVTLVEQHRQDSTEACGADATCTTDIAVTEAPVASSPFQLTFTFLSSNKNLTWYKNGVPVVDCPQATQLPTDTTACVTSRSKPSSTSVRLGVLWRGGPDPSWTG
jgi:hypothetical protein